MTISKFAALTALALTMTTAPSFALAGDASWKYSDGTKLRITCRSSGCTVKAKKPGGSWTVVETGEGGRKNFLVLEAKYKKMKPKV